MNATGTGRKRVVIVDDEPASIAGLRSVLDEFDELEVVAEVRDGLGAIEAISHHRPDLVFLDIEMPGVSGFEVASQTNQFLHQLVFVTAYDQYALDAFRTHAIDYLLKPVRPSVLRRCIEKILRQEDVVAEVLQKQEPTREELVLSDGSDVRVLNQEHICLVEGLGRYRRIHLTPSGFDVHETQTIVTDTTLDELESQLAGPQFLRLHRSYIVHLGCILELYLESRRYFVKLADLGLKVPVSRSKISELKSRLR
jgi:DNA-binding LytR/AlgR family response regulator